MLRNSPSIMHVALASIALAGAIGMANADDLPDYMQPIAGHPTSTPAETATKNVLALNSSMFELYDSAARVFQKNILNNHPIILGLFSGAGSDASGARLTIRQNPSGQGKGLQT